MGAGDVSFGEECHFVDNTGAILVSQPVNQGFVAFTAEGLATAGSFLFSSLGGAEVTTSRKRCHMYENYDN
jgi:hypothetical protein